MSSFDLQLLYRVRENPDAFISEPLFNLLDGFHAGYSLFTSSTERLVIVDFRGWLIEKYSLQNNSYLVTSRYNDPALLNRAVGLGIKVVAKSLVAIAPINVIE